MKYLKLNEYKYNAILSSIMTIGLGTGLLCNNSQNNNDKIVYNNLTISSFLVTGFNLIKYIIK
jgi:hypothetical protein